MTNTNQSVHFLRNPALDATTGIDGVYANPAGLIFLTDGLHFSLNNSSLAGRSCLGTARTLNRHHPGKGGGTQKNSRLE